MTKNCPWANCLKNKLTIVTKQNIVDNIDCPLENRQKAFNLSRKKKCPANRLDKLSFVHFAAQSQFQFFFIINNVSKLPYAFA